MPPAIMIRRLYQAILYLHPRDFRERFAEEMLWIFDEEFAEGNSGRLLLMESAL